MRSLILLVAIFFSLRTLAEDFFAVPPVTFLVTSSEGLYKLNQSLTYPESLLKRFKPEGALISKKIVNQQSVSFYAKKSYFGISQTVFVSGTLEAQEQSKLCPKNETGFSIKFSFQGSDAIVSDNIDRISVVLCAKTLNPDLLSVLVRARIYKSAHYSNFLGSIVKEMIEAQVTPLIKALRQDVSNQEIR